MSTFTKASRLAGGLVLALFVSAAVAEQAERAAVEPFPAEWHWGNPQQRAQQNELVGKPMPQLDVAGWMNGEVGPEQMQGQIVVLNFWATWCGPCIRGIPTFNQLHDRYNQQGVRVVGICASARGQERMGEIAQQHNIKYPIARDHQNRSAPAFRVMWYPTYAIVDRNGIVRAVGLRPDFVERAIQQLLEEQPREETAAAE